jgi:predicted dithiol-disulfide oxidoreductase (DUF899 family)
MTVVSREEWLAARRDLLVKEKEFTRQRDALSAERRKLPWVKVEKAYVFDAPAGKQALAELFGGRSQLIVYHFMFGPGWAEGCPSCSLLGDHTETTSIVIIKCRSQRKNWQPQGLLVSERGRSGRQRVLQRPDRRHLPHLF